MSYHWHSDVEHSASSASECQKRMWGMVVQLSENISGNATVNQDLIEPNDSSCDSSIRKEKPNQEKPANEVQTDKTILFQPLPD